MKPPTGWMILRFGDVTRIANGQVSPNQAPYLYYLHIGPENIESETGRLVNLAKACELGLISGKYEFDDKAIVYSKIRPNLNKVCRPGFRGICSADAYPIWANEKIVRTGFLLHTMRSPQFVKQATACSMRSGLPKINREDLADLEFWAPSMNEQSVIESILSTWESALYLVAEQISVIKLQKCGLLQQLLTGQKRFKEFRKDSWSHLHASEIFKPRSERNIGNWLVLSVTQDQGVVFRNSLERRIGGDEANFVNYKKVYPGDFVISLRSFQGGLEYSTLKGAVSPAYHVIQPKIEINSEFFRHFFKSYEFVKRLAFAVIGIRDGKQIDFDDFSYMKLPFPKIEEQKRIADVLNACDKEIELLQKQLELLKEQKRGLMQKLLTGEIRVKVPKGA